MRTNNRHDQNVCETVGRTRSNPSARLSARWRECAPILVRNGRLKMPNYDVVLFRTNSICRLGPLVMSEPSIREPLDLGFGMTIERLPRAASDAIARAC